jgi:small-conductance mechanosensitive channel
VLTKLLTTIFTIALLVLARFLILRLAMRKAKDPAHIYQWRKVTDYTAFLIGVLVIGRIWVEAFGSISTFLGLVSAGIAIALKDPIVNLAGWGYLLWLRPIKIGDRVQIGDRRGDVINMGTFQFSLMEIGRGEQGESSTGRIIYVPNGIVFTENVINFSHGFPYIWTEVPVCVTFESNWEKAKDILERIGIRYGENLTKTAESELKKTAHKFLIHQPQFEPTIFTKVLDNGIELAVRYICKPQDKRVTEHAIWEAVLTDFAKHDDIALAYPTTRIYREPEEGVEAQAARSKSGGTQQKKPRAHG